MVLSQLSRAIRHGNSGRDCRVYKPEVDRQQVTKHRQKRLQRLPIALQRDTRMTNRLGSVGPFKVLSEWRGWDHG